MRVIAGDFKGRRLKAVPGQNTRPTTDKVKESIFNIIGPYFDGGHCLDLYAGSGALSIEAVSRGIEHAVLVDKQYKAVKTIHENVELTRAPDRFQVEKKSASQALSMLENSGQAFDLVFLDPPYANQQIEKDIQWMEEHQLLNDGAVVVCETAEETVLPSSIKGLVKIKENQYGTIRITVYEKE
ncbi:16S rRNA (guanine(966)-N(2))-methyltransferase RsmD [Atopococcus tabaci]|uniref:16S rRNA (guanine(966)-N(2))-methyltransferase RsmD n=1 Tax=Atopococcus tabaci TaxID=269774 RepID=UPI00041139E3|nr:16S rRNA (guanine(966)-N(2))-methyltransferase RsmD [Atopococcus tabaci]